MIINVNDKLLPDSFFFFDFGSSHTAKAVTLVALYLSPPCIVKNRSLWLMESDSTDENQIKFL